MPQPTIEPPAIETGNRSEHNIANTAPQEAPTLAQICSLAYVLRGICHIGLTGDYLWKQNKQPHKGKYRPLRAF